MQKQLFVDLDGVLADFDQGVKKASGRLPSEMSPREMWPILARTKGFYQELGWMPGGKELWERVGGLAPVILTGLPMGKWAEPQKRSWCLRELGEDVPVITGLSRHKSRLAREWLERRGREGFPAVLVDDRLSLKESWENEGGVFIHHQTLDKTLEELETQGILLKGE